MQRCPAAVRFPPTERTPGVCRDRRRAGTGERARGGRPSDRRQVAARSRPSEAGHLPNGSAPYRWLPRIAASWGGRRARSLPRRNASSRRPEGRGGGRPGSPPCAAQHPRPAVARARTARGLGPPRHARCTAVPRAGRAKSPPRSTVRSPRHEHGSSGARLVARCPAGRPTPLAEANAVRVEAAHRANRHGAGTRGSAPA